jgi:probable phosphoglycerate mutase
MKIAFEIIYLLLTVVGATASVWFFVDQVNKLKKLSWRSAEKSAEIIASSLGSDDFMPSLIVGIGRGGAIFGAMISGCLGHRPLLVIDRKYTWIDGRRVDDLILKLSLPEELLSKVLLVAGEVHTGNTMKLYYDHFIHIGAKEVRRGVLLLQDGCTEKIEYYGIKSKIDRKMPWMFSKQYRRESRSQEEARGLSTMKTQINE